MSAVNTWIKTQEKVARYYGIILADFTILIWNVIIFNMIGIDIRYYDETSSYYDDTNKKLLNALVLLGLIIGIVGYFKVKKKRKELPTNWKLQYIQSASFWVILVMGIGYLLSAFDLGWFFGRSIDHQSSIVLFQFYLMWILGLSLLYSLLANIKHNKGRIYKKQKSIIYGLIVNSKTYLISELNTQTLIEKSLIYNIISDLLVQGQLQGKIENNRFIPIEADYNQTNQFYQKQTQTAQSAFTTPNNTDDEKNRITNAMKNLENKFKSGEIDELTYFKLKSEYQQRLLG